MKTCKVCKTEFSPHNSTQKVCNWQCALEYARQTAAEARRKEIRRDLTQRKAKLKTRSEWLREAQAAFNAYIRERDKGLACISCGRHHQGQNHAGHYRTTKAAPELRFHPDNCHLQCQPCNTHLSGNVVEYRLNLIKRIGQDRVEWLEGPHTVQKYSIEDAKEIKAYYKQQLKELK